MNASHFDRAVAEFGNAMTRIPGWPQRHREVMQAFVLDEDARSWRRCADLKPASAQRVRTTEHEFLER